jgi:HlyD family secretion protein
MMEKKKTTKMSKKMIGIIVAAILVLSAVGIYMTLYSGAIQVETAVIEKATVLKLIKETGTVESDSSSVITAKSAMEIKRFDFKEGDSIKAGQVILQTDLTAAQLTVKSMESDAAGLRVQYNRAKETAAQSKLLFEQGAISQDDYLLATTAEKQLAAQVSSINYAIASMRENLDTGGITAPIDGVITQVYVKVGEIAQPGSPIVEISDLQSLYIAAELIASDADQIKTGSKVLVYNTDANFRDEKAFVRKIYLKAMDLVSDLGISQKRVKVEIALSGNQSLRLGNTMDVEITADSRENVIAVPKKAVFEMTMKNQVYVVEQGKAMLRDVELGLKGEDFWEVLSGLSVGEIVIISPGNDISAGTRVKI